MGIVIRVTHEPTQKKLYPKSYFFIYKSKLFEKNKFVRPETNRISREWRQKIESWLQANESDDKHSEDYKRRMRRVAINRRSLETDTGIFPKNLQPCFFFVMHIQYLF
jgi:hypothetical protein